MQIDKLNRIHLIGIGGTGMRGLALLLLQKGCVVSGSDTDDSPYITTLQEQGATIHIGHAAELIQDIDLIAFSTAIPKDNVERVAGEAKGIPCINRSELLNLLLCEHTTRIAVAGTHGKTTTTAMIATIFAKKNLNPSYLIGSQLNTTNISSQLGSSDYFITEADESDGSFLLLDSNCSVVTNIDNDHMNFFKTPENLLAHFTRFMEKTIQNKGALILNADDPSILSCVDDSWRSHCLFFGINTPAFVQAKDIRYHAKGVSFVLHIDQKAYKNVNLSIYGNHNIYNALAAVATALRGNIDPDTIIQGLESFTGTQRRFQKIADENGIQIYDDYAHHPTEIRTTLTSTRNSLNGRIICIFQPHRISRTEELLSEFADSFHEIDKLVITNTYTTPNEKKDPRITTEALCETIRNNGQKNVSYIPNLTDIPRTIRPMLQKGDIVITMGAGNIHTVANELKRLL